MNFRSASPTLPLCGVVSITLMIVTSFPRLSNISTMALVAGLDMPIVFSVVLADKCVLIIDLTALLLTEIVGVLMLSLVLSVMT